MGSVVDDIKETAHDIGNTVARPFKEVGEGVSQGLQNVVYDPIKENIRNPIQNSIAGYSAGIKGIGEGVGQAANGAGKFIASEQGQQLLGAAGMAYLGGDPSSYLNRKEFATGGQDGTGAPLNIPSGLGQQIVTNQPISKSFIYIMVALVVSAIVFVIIRRRK